MPTLCERQLGCVSTDAFDRGASQAHAATFAAISALVMAEQHGDSTLGVSQQTDFLNTAYQGDLSELVLSSVCALAEHQNADGGWGPTAGAPSDLATSLLALSAFRLTCVPARRADLEPRLEQYLRGQGGIGALRKSKRHRVFVASVLANCALAGVVEWRKTPPVGIERAAAPHWVRRWLEDPTESHSNPAYLAVGVARAYHVRPLNPLLRWVRHASVGRALEMIARRQAADGGFNESVLDTGFVVMSLAGARRADHRIVRRGVERLLASVHADASWSFRTEP